MANSSPARRPLGALLLLACSAGLLYLYWSATAFPTEDPITVVDAALVERLRQEPGLHLALSPDYRLEVELDLRDDSVNRRVYGTHVDLREVRDERAIHIQLKGEGGAIHTDGANPKAGVVALLIHAGWDLPFLELIAGWVVGAWLLFRPVKQAGEEEPAAA